MVNYTSMLTRSPTYDTFGKWLVLQCGQPQVPNLHWACGTRDENIVTLEIPMNDWRGTSVQEVQPFQDLSTPVF